MISSALALFVSPPCARSPREVEMGLVVSVSPCSDGTHLCGSGSNRHVAVFQVSPEQSSVG